MFLSCPRSDMYTQTHYNPPLAPSCMIHQIAHILHQMQDRGPLNASLQGRLILVIELFPSYFYDWDVAISCDQLTSTSILIFRQQSTSCSFLICLSNPSHGHNFPKSGALHYHAPIHPHRVSCQLPLLSASCCRSSYKLALPIITADRLSNHGPDSVQHD